jgi:hypothetical protein
MYQYRITVNGTQSPIGAYPENWGFVADQIEARGGYAKLERRLVTDKSFLDFQPDNVMVLGDKVVTHWRILAELEL